MKRRFSDHEDSVSIAASDSDSSNSNAPSISSFSIPIPAPPAKKLRKRSNGHCTIEQQIELSIINQMH